MKRLSPPTKPDHYNVRVITRLRDGGEIVIELTEVPAALYHAHFGVPLLTNLFEKTDIEGGSFVGTPAKLPEPTP